MSTDARPQVHPSACVDEGARLGEGTKVWHFCHVFSGATIGANCRIGQNVVIHSTVQVGDNVKIQNNVSLYDGVVLEDDVFCGPSCVFTNIVNPRSAVPRNSADHYRKTLVRRGATIGANATIICGVELGEHCFIGAGAVVTKDVLPYALVYGNPARQYGWMCECGIKLAVKDNRAVCADCRRSYELKAGRLALDRSS